MVAKKQEHFSLSLSSKWVCYHPSYRHDDCIHSLVKQGKCPTCRGTTIYAVIAPMMHFVTMVTIQSFVHYNFCHRFRTELVHFIQFQISNSKCQRNYIRPNWSLSFFFFFLSLIVHQLVCLWFLFCFFFFDFFNKAWFNSSG